MGRKTKKGLDYFSLVTKFSDSVKLCAYEAGGVSICVLIELWQNIYANNGYYMEFTDDHKMLFINSSMAKISNDEFDKIMSVFFKRGVFDKEMFEKYQILTSDSVQERYFEACNVSKRTNVLIYSEYLLIKIDEKYKNNLIIENKLGVNTDKLGINTYLLNINSEESTQSKVKESKVKEIKVKENKNSNKLEFTFSECIQELRNSDNFKIDCERILKINRNKFDEYLNNFEFHNKPTNENELFEFDKVRSHFSYWLKNNKDKLPQSVQQPSNKTIIIPPK